VEEVLRVARASTTEAVLTAHLSSRNLSAIAPGLSRLVNLRWGRVSSCSRPIEMHTEPRPCVCVLQAVRPELQPPGLPAAPGQPACAARAQPAGQLHLLHKCGVLRHATAWLPMPGNAGPKLQCPGPASAKLPGKPAPSTPPGHLRQATSQTSGGLISPTAQQDCECSGIICSLYSCSGAAW
jgi:hypothetical protein